MNVFVRFGLATLLFALFILGCTKDDSLPLDVICSLQSDDMIGTFYTANGEMINFSIVIDKDKSTAGLSVRQIEVFMNNIKIDEVFDEERIDVNYQLKNKTIGKNPLRITINATAPNYKETTTHINMTVNVLESKPIFGFDLLASDIWRNGSLTSISVKEIEDTTLSLTINSVSFYVDDTLIGYAKGTDSISYYVEGLTQGNHSLSVSIDCTTFDGQITTLVSKSKQITVQ